MNDIISIGPDGTVSAPATPTIPFIRGDGIGPEVWAAAEQVFNAAVKKCYGGQREVNWLEVFAGERALNEKGALLPDATVDAIRKYHVAIKAPLTTPVGGGFRSVNVSLRVLLDLFSCIRPVSHFPGVPSPLVRPDDVDMVIFRENTEDVYVGLEWEAGSPEAAEVIALVERLGGKKVRVDSGIGIKPISKTGSQRLVRRAIEYALQNGRTSVTLVHKGNIMKHTEGAFARWGYELAAEEFGDRTVTEKDVKAHHGGTCPEGKIVIKDRIADAMFQEILLHPAQYSVLALPNLNGDYISDALAATVGGLGIAPGANIGNEYALFEATHGSAPAIAGQNKANPTSLILSGAMMFEFLGWVEVKDAIESAVTAAIASKRVTIDLAENMPGATTLTCSDFADNICANL